MQYGRHDWLERRASELGHIQVLIKTGPAGRMLRITGDKVTGHLEWLHKQGFIHSLRMESRGRWSFLLAPVKEWAPHGS